MKIKKPDMQTAKNLYNKGKAAVKETVEQLNQKVVPKIDEAVSQVDAYLNPPKIEVLRSKMIDAQKAYLIKSAAASGLERLKPGQNIITPQELKKLEEKALKAADAYNSFASKQAAAQKAFNELNGIK